MPSEIYTLRLQATLGGEFRENIFHFSGSGTDPNDTRKAATDLGVAWQTHLRVFWLNLFPETYELQNIYTKRTFPKPSCSSTAEFLPGVQVGTNGVQASAQQTCPCVFFIPQMGFLSGGKCFLPAAPQGAYSNNQPAGAWITAVNTYFNAAIGGNAGTFYTWQQIIYSKKYNSVSTVQSFHLSPVVGLMHKRKLVSGRGIHKKKAP